MNTPVGYICFVLLLSLASCDSFRRPIDLDLPEVERQLVVECYLRPNEPYRLLLTETKGYFDELDECPMVRGALVVIEQAGRRDTLREAAYLGDCSLTNPNFIPFFDETRTRFYNYGSDAVCPLDYTQDFRLEIIDEAGGRSAVATTRMIAPISFSSIELTWDEAGEKAFAFLRARDNGDEVNFYRIQLHKNRLFRPDSLTGGFFNVAKNPEFDIVIDDEPLFNGNDIAFGTNYDFEEGDTLIATLYHIEKAYYDYLGDISSSSSANGNPFAQPLKIRSNIQGGTGVFTFLLYDRDTVAVQR